MKEKILKKIEFMIDNSSLDADDKKHTLSLLSRLPVHALIEIYQLIKKDTKWLLIISQNLKDKSKAFKEKDSNFWDKIIEDEKLELIKLAAKEGFS